MLGIKPGAAEWEARMLALCYRYAAPLQTSIVFRAQSPISAEMFRGRALQHFICAWAIQVVDSDQYGCIADGWLCRDSQITPLGISEREREREREREKERENGWDTYTHTHMDMLTHRPQKQKWDRAQGMIIGDGKKRERKRDKHVDKLTSWAEKEGKRDSMIDSWDLEELNFYLLKWKSNRDEVLTEA